MAQWIAHPYGDGTLNWNDACDFMRPVRHSPVLRKRFALKKPLVSGRLYVTGLGYFEVKIDGRLVSDGFYRTWGDTWRGLAQAPWTDHPKMFFELEDAAGNVVLASDETW